MNKSEILELIKFSNGFYYGDNKELDKIIDKGKIEDKILIAENGYALELLSQDDDINVRKASVIGGWGGKVKINNENEKSFFDSLYRELHENDKLMQEYSEHCGYVDIKEYK